MLTLLKIKNIALIDDLAIEFAPGLNLLTGETGSGKSIIVDSLGALTGDRVSSDLIKEGSASAVIEGIVGEAMRTMSREDGAPRLLVAALAGCRHSLGATLVGAAAAADGWSVVYLGADVPAEEIAEGATRSGASVVAVSAVYADDARALGAALRGLRGMLPARVELLVGGRAALGASRELAGSAIGTGATLADLRALLRTVRDRIETGQR